MIEIKESRINFEKVYSSDYAPNDSNLRQANLLLLPYHNYRQDVEYCFSEYSEDFLQYLRENGAADIKPDIAISDEKYQVLQMHSTLLDIGLFITTSILLPFAVNLLSSYIYDKIKSMHEKKENVSIRVEIISQNEHGASKSIKYEGPASEFEAMKESTNKILEK